MTLVPVLALAMCLLLPGLGWARKMRFGDRGDTLALGIVLSMCATIVVGTAMAVSGAWSPAAGMAVLALIAAVGFLPVGSLADRVASWAEPRRPTPAFGDDGGEWAEWIAYTRQQAARRRRQGETEAAAAADVWIDWYQRTQLLTSRRDEEGPR